MALPDHDLIRLIKEREQRFLEVDRDQALGEIGLGDNPPRGADFKKRFIAIHEEYEARQRAVAEADTLPAGRHDPFLFVDDDSDDPVVCLRMTSSEWASCFVDLLYACKHWLETSSQPLWPKERLRYLLLLLSQASETGGVKILGPARDEWLKLRPHLDLVP